jgi:hypothetical protein
VANWIDKFFGDYAEAFRSNSQADLLKKFTIPLVFLAKSGPIALNDQESISANMDTLMSRYQLIGAVDFKYAIRNAQRIGSEIHMVEVEWKFFNAGNELLYACDTSYILAGETNANARVMAVIAHNENDEYQKALSQRGGV